MREFAQRTSWEENKEKSLSDNKESSCEAKGNADSKKEANRKGTRSKKGRWKNLVKG